MAAKDIIDVQVTVETLNLDFGQLLESLQLTMRDDITCDHCPPGLDVSAEQLEKRYCQKLGRPINIHIRAAGSFNTKYALLCRDFLKANRMAREAYGEIKHQLANRFSEDAEAYYQIKDPVFDVLVAGALVWADANDWSIPSSDI